MVPSAAASETCTQTRATLPRRRTTPDDPTESNSLERRPFSNQQLILGGYVYDEQQQNTPVERCSLSDY